jgi:hypothetical protein
MECAVLEVDTDLVAGIGPGLGQRVDGVDPGAIGLDSNEADAPAMWLDVSAPDAHAVSAALVIDERSATAQALDDVDLRLGCRFWRRDRVVAKCA